MTIEPALVWTDDDSEPVWMRHSLSGLEALGTIPPDWPLSAAEQAETGENRARLVGLRIINRFFVPRIAHRMAEAQTLRAWLQSVVQECERRAQPSWWEDKTADELTASRCSDIFRSYVLDLEEVCSAMDDLLARLSRASILLAEESSHV